MIKRIWDFLMCRTTDKVCPNIPIAGPLFWYGIVVPIGHMLYGIECAVEWFNDLRNK